MATSPLKTKHHWIAFLSIFYILLSLILLVIGFLTLDVSNGALDESQLQAPSIAIVVTGFILLVISLLGLYAGWLLSFQDQDYVKPALRAAIAFGTGSLFLMLVVFSSGIALLRYRRFIVDVKDNSFNSVGERILMYELAVFEKCCSPIASPPELCIDNGFIFPCVSERDRYESFLNFVGDRTCTYFEEAGITSRENPESCGGQSLPDFIPEICAFLYAQFTILGSVNIIFTVFLGCVTSAVVWSLWTNVDFRENDDEYAESVADLKRTKEIRDGTESKGYTDVESSHKGTDFGSSQRGTEFDSDIESNE